MSTTASRSDRLTHGFEELRAEAARSGWPSIARRFARDFSENGLPVFASALSFRILLALVPLALFGVAVLGFLELDDVWTDSVAPRYATGVRPGIHVIDRTAERVLTAKETWWLTVGAGVALREVSRASA